MALLRHGWNSRRKRSLCWPYNSTAKNGEMKVVGVGLSKPGHTCWTIPELTANPELMPELILFRLRISALLCSRTYSKTSLEYCLLTEFGSGTRLGATSTAQCRFSPFPEMLSNGRAPSFWGCSLPLRCRSSEQGAHAEEPRLSFSRQRVV